jgi:hypothetical protein
MNAKIQYQIGKQSAEGQGQIIWLAPDRYRAELLLHRDSARGIPISRTHNDEMPLVIYELHRATTTTMHAAAHESLKIDIVKAAQSAKGGRRKDGAKLLRGVYGRAVAGSRREPARVPAKLSVRLRLAARRQNCRRLQPARWNRIAQWPQDFWLRLRSCLRLNRMMRHPLASRRWSRVPEFHRRSDVWNAAPMRVASFSSAPGSFVEFTAICCLQLSPSKRVLSENGDS